MIYVYITQSIYYTKLKRDMIIFSEQLSFKFTNLKTVMWSTNILDIYIQSFFSNYHDRWFSIEDKIDEKIFTHLFVWWKNQSMAALFIFQSNSSPVGGI